MHNTQSFIYIFGHAFLHPVTLTPLLPVSFLFMPVVMIRLQFKDLAAGDILGSSGADFKYDKMLDYGSQSNIHAPQNLGKRSGYGDSESLIHT